MLTRKRNYWASYARTASHSDRDKNHKYMAAANSSSRLRRWGSARQQSVRSALNMIAAGSKSLNDVAASEAHAESEWKQILNVRLIGYELIRMRRRRMLLLRHGSGRWRSGRRLLAARTAPFHGIGR